MNTNVVVILGGGTDGTLTPILYTKERLHFFVKNIVRKEIPIVVSGGYSVWLKKRPKYTEAEVMKNFLVKKGFRNILVENKSRDTVGNIFYTKQILSKNPGWKNILVVTTRGHRLRSEWLFKTIFGSAYSFKYLEAPTLTGNFGTKKRKEYENYVVGVYKKMLKGIKPGDDKNILKRLKQKHPAFSQTKSAKALALEINEAKQHFLGFVNPLDKKKNVPR